MAAAFLQLRPPQQHQQEEEDGQPSALTVAKLALFVAINGFLSPAYLRRCMVCDDGGARRRCFAEAADVEQMCYQLANFATAVLGVVLLAAHVAPPPPALSSAVAVWLVWFTRVLTCGTLQFGLNILHFCLKMICFRLMRRDGF